jgi:hypothetical protein
MTFEEAIRKSIKNYMKGKMPESVKEVRGGLKYDLKFFDKLEEDFLKDSPKKTKKGKKDDPELDSEEL